MFKRLRGIHGTRAPPKEHARRRHLEEAERRLQDLLDSEYVDTDRDESDEGS